jgi:hypothetical protein
VLESEIALTSRHPLPEFEKLREEITKAGETGLPGDETAIEAEAQVKKGYQPIQETTPDKNTA